MVIAIVPINVKIDELERIESSSAKKLSLSYRYKIESGLEFKAG